MKITDQNLKSVYTERGSYLFILNKLSQYLKTANLNEQAQVIQKHIDLLHQENLHQFIKSINSIDMWGGSGAVWEVYIDNKEFEKEFENEMINLINLMENTNILGKGIKPIRKIFKRNLNLK